VQEIIGESEAPTPERHGWRCGLLVVLLVTLLFATIRWRLRDMPLERDEGEYAYAGQLILQGIPPYQIAYNMKLPGTYVAYAVIMGIFGQTAAGIHQGLLLANALTILLLFALGKRLLGTLAGAVAAATYALLSAGPWVNGCAGHATHFVVLLAMAGLWVLLSGLEQNQPWKIFAAGLLLGLAVVAKQPGAALVLFGALYLLYAGGWSWKQLQQSLRRLAWFGGGAVLPFALTCLVLWRAGVFPKFWFWTFAYAYEYGTKVSPAEGWGFFLAKIPLIVEPVAGVWIFAAIGLAAFLWSGKARTHAFFLLGFFVFSCLAVSAGLYFRRHYFILMLPALSLLVGLGVSASATLLGQGKPGRWRLYLPVALFAGAFAYAIYQQSYFFFRADPDSASRMVYWREPFPEARELGNYIRENSPASAQIAVLGSEPEILFYARRRSASGYLYTYGLTENQKYARVMQREVIQEIEAARPEFLIFVEDWVVQPGADQSIFHWSRQYVAEHYQLLGVMRVGDGLQLRSESEIAQRAGNMIGASFLFKRTNP